MNTALYLVPCLLCYCSNYIEVFNSGSSTNILNVSCPCTPHDHPVPFIILAFPVVSVGLTIRPAELRKR